MRRGWPQLRYLDDGHPDDQDVDASLRRVLEAVDPHYHLVWPIRVAHAYVRLVGSQKRVGDRLGRFPRARRYPIL